VASTEAIVVYRTNPHLDPVERAVEASGILVQTIRGEVKPVQCLEQVPMVINIVKQPTAFGPMKAIMDDVAAVVKKPGVLSASCGQGFPYADVEQMGISFLVVTNNDRKLAEQQAQWLAKRAWDRRAELQNDSPSPAEALKRAINAPSDSGKPTVIMDVGDNVGGGGSADSTHLLAEAKRLGASGVLMSLFDPEAVQACIRAGVGADVTLKAGGKTDNMHGKPIEVSGHIRAITDGKFEEPKPIHGGWRFFDYGPTVALDTPDGSTIVLHTNRGIGNMSRQQYYAIGIFPEKYRIVICKGTVSPRAAYEPIAREIIMADTPGVTAADLSSFAYKRRRRPLYPFEPDAKYGG
jgi:microcystin degradation protein MlrC